MKYRVNRVDEYVDWYVDYRVKHGEEPEVSEMDELFGDLNVHERLGAARIIMTQYINSEGKFDADPNRSVR